ncbi:MAG TPA: hypothetical protein VF463_02295 [Sphingobium sp.]
MGKLDNGIHAHSASRSGKQHSDNGDYAAWPMPIRRRTLWARIRMFHWPHTPVRPEIDRSLADRIEQGVSFLSRMAGPILLIAAMAAIIWSIRP